MKGQQAAKLGILGAIVSALFGSGALLAISCCAGPLVFLGLGLGWAGLAKFQSMAPYRWIFFALTGIFLTISFYKIYFPKKICEGDECPKPGSLRYQRIALWITFFMVVASLIFPVLYERYLAR
jgi:mercuric ion transport protein